MLCYYQLMKHLFFPAIFNNPSKISFAEQEVHEKLVLFLRQHPIVNLPWIFSSLFAVILPIILLQSDVFFGTGIFTQVPNDIFAGGIIVYYLLILGYIVEQFLHWYFNTYIVTNLHLLDVDFDSILHRKITEVNLKDVESVKTNLVGVSGSLFNYGDVIIETAAARQMIDFYEVPRPDFVADTIQDLVSATGDSRPE